MQITNSPDIGVLEVSVAFNLSGTTPVINLTNQTTANQNVSPIPVLDTLEWVLNIFSPTGTPIIQSDFNNPWKVGVWTTEQLTNAWPNPFNQIEWSGADYLVQFQVKDSVGNIYDLNKEGQLSRPTGNTQKTANTFGAVALTAEILCDSANIYLKDNTSKSYQGLTGVLASAYLAVDYPRDSTGVKPTPFIITSFTTDALIPFTFNARGYEATYYSIYTYDLGDNVFVTIRYTAQICFDVQCNIDLCPLACEVKSLEESIQSGRCADIQSAQAKLNLITPKLLRAFIAKANPTCGIDLPALIEEIKVIGGFGCDCYGANTGIGSSVSNDFIFSVNNQGGDIQASFQVTGNNVTLTVKDKSYTFGPSTGSQAILLVPTIGNTNTNVGLSVNLNTLATDIYNETANNSTLLNLFNSLVLNTGFTLVVDGKCVINNGGCNYVFTLANIPDTPVSSFLSAIQSSIPANNIPVIEFAFNLSTLPALQNKLNTLGIGTFVVADAGGGNVTISTNNNNFALTALVYSPGGGNKVFAATSTDCTGTIPITPTEIIQGIIDYLCDLDDSKIITSQDYTICYIDPTTLLATTKVVTAGTSLADFITELLARDCDTITVIEGITSGSGLSCQVIKANFPASTKVLQENDVIYGTKEQDCAPIYPVEFGTKMLEYGLTNVDFMAAFCAAVSLCAGGGICEPYSTFSLSTVENSPADNQLDIIVTFVHPSAVSNNIRYARTDLGGTLVWSAPVNVLPGASPYTFANVDDGQYIVGITPVYSDGRVCAEQTTSTGSCGLINAFAAAFDGTDIQITYSAPVSVPKVRVVINYPNGGTFSQIYTNGASIAITPPVGLYGSYTLTMQAVCNENTNWFGQATAPAVIVVPVPSVLQNNASDNITGSYFGQYQIGTNSPVVFLTAAGLASGASKALSIADGFYDTIQFEGSFSTSGNHSATLVTGSGVYNATVVRLFAVNVFEFTNVQVVNGFVASIIDASP